MDKIKKVENSDGEFKNAERKNIKTYYELCKKNLVPGMATGAMVAAYTIQIYGPGGLEEVLVFGGVTGMAVMLAVNAVITGHRINKEKRNEIKKQIELHEEDQKGRHL